MLVLNEVREAERVLSNPDDTECNSTQIINILTRYYLQEKKLNIDDAEEMVAKFIFENIYNKHMMFWDYTIRRFAKFNYPLKRLDSIPITQREIDEIKTIDDFRLQKVAFSCLVISKCNLMTMGNTWVNFSEYKVSVMANCKNCDINAVYYQLHQLGFVDFPRNYRKINVKYNHVDMDGQAVAEVRRASNLGNWWAYINGDKRYKVCADCGTIFIPSNNKQKFCDKHKTSKVKSDTYVCMDCGREFPKINGRKHKRCDRCTRFHNYEYYRDKHKEYKGIEPKKYIDRIDPYRNEWRFTEERLNKIKTRDYSEFY